MEKKMSSLTTCVVYISELHKDCNVCLNFDDEYEKIFQIISHSCKVENFATACDINDKICPISIVDIECEEMETFEGKDYVNVCIVLKFASSASIFSLKTWFERTFPDQDLEFYTGSVKSEWHK